MGWWSPVSDILGLRFCRLVAMCHRYMWWCWIVDVKCYGYVLWQINLLLLLLLLLLLQPGSLSSDFIDREFRETASALSLSHAVVRSGEHRNPGFNKIDKLMRWVLPSYVTERHATYRPPALALSYTCLQTPCTTSDRYSYCHRLSAARRQDFVPEGAGVRQRIWRCTSVGPCHTVSPMNNEQWTRH